MEVRYTLKQRPDGQYDIHERDVPETYYIISGPFESEQACYDYIEKDLNAMGEQLAKGQG